MAILAPSPKPVLLDMELDGFGPEVEVGLPVSMGIDCVLDTTPVWQGFIISIFPGKNQIKSHRVFVTHSQSSGTHK